MFSFTLSETSTALVCFALGCSGASAGNDDPLLTAGAGAPQGNAGAHAGGSSAAGSSAAGLGQAGAGPSSGGLGVGGASAGAAGAGQSAGGAGSAGGAPMGLAGASNGMGENTAPDDAPSGQPPDFGPNVQIFDASMSMADIQTKLDATKNKQSEFASGRYAYFFKPGQYKLDVRVGYYMQALGLGAAPDDVTITGAVRSKPELDNNNATTTFWKAVENLAVVPTQDNNIEVWAVSQGTSFRRVHVKGSINLSDNGWSSGGFIADTKIDGQIASGSQQQFFTRNTDLGKWSGGSYNMVFVGDQAAPASNWPSNSYSVLDATPVLREKPYLYVDGSGNYFVRVPALQQKVSGYSWAAGKKPSGRGITTGNFYIAKAATDSATSMNAALASGKHLLLTPGVYHLDASLQVKNKDTVVMGLGLATLIPDNGTPAISVADVDGVKVSGLILQANSKSSENMLTFGDAVSSVSHAQNPSSVHDISCRVGGAAAGKATTCITINSNDVIGDNLWLWRADHTVGVGWDQNVSLHGLVVNGNNVTMYGLFSEHFEQYQTLWNGNGGQTYFYQSELPYDPPNQQAWTHDGVNGYASYKVASSVTTHTAIGVGVYGVFQTAVVDANAIEFPNAPSVKVSHMVTTCFGGNAGSQITHIYNGTGDYVSPSHGPSHSAE